MRVVHIEIAGQVQGVGFRHFLKENAGRLGLAGWVRNLSSGNVEVAARGTPDSIEEFVGIAKNGPDGAKVKQVITLVPLATLELPYPFTILR